MANNRRFNDESNVPDTATPDETVIENKNVESTSDADTEARENDEQPMIVHRERTVDAAGNVQEKEHGPMPVEDWPRYERDNEL